MHFDAGRLRPTARLSLTPERLHTLALSPASWSRRLAPSPVLHSNPGAVLHPTPPCPLPLVQLSHAPQQARPTYVSTSSYLFILHPQLQNSLLQGPTTDTVPHGTEPTKSMSHRILEAVLSFLPAFLKALPGAVLRECRSYGESHTETPDPARLREPLVGPVGKRGKYHDSCPQLADETGSRGKVGTR